VLAIIVVLVLVMNGCQPHALRFEGRRAMDHAKAQMAFGPRPVGSAANRQTSDYIAQELTRQGWQVEFQEFAEKGVAVRNVIAKKGQGPIIILGAHFDTRPLADRDPSDRSQPVPGANDGASGVAVLLELARVLDPTVFERTQIWLAFFDAEDRGGLDGWEFCVGSKHMADDLAQHPENRPEWVLVLDMIGDAEQNIYYEWTSALWLQERIWQIAADKGYQRYFIPQQRYSIIDDNSSFLRWGMPAAVVIDFDYRYWHTRDDTLDKISVDSLQRMGDVVETLLEGEPLRAGAVIGTEPSVNP